MTEPISVVRKTIQAMILLATGTGLAVADTIRVPADQPTIQAGIDAANPGDIVLVADGVYTGAGNRDIDFHGKAITVRSENGATSCVIDCEGTSFDQHRGMRFRDEDEGVVIRGLTIRGGLLDENVDGKGAGILCDGGSSTIIECIIEHNVSYRADGGGIFIASGDLLLVRCIVRFNSAGSYGGGLSSIDAHLTLIDSTIVGNFSVLGGGIRLAGGSMTASGCTITENVVFGFDIGSGGGIFASNADLELSDCRFFYNRALTFEGGAISQRGGSLVAKACEFSRNLATTHGGGLYYVGNDAQILNCIFDRNVAEHWDGGGLFMGPSGAVRNCTFYANNAGREGDGLFGPAIVDNCIIWENSTQPLAGKPMVSFSNVQGG